MWCDLTLSKLNRMFDVAHRASVGGAQLSPIRQHGSIDSALPDRHGELLRGCLEYDDKLRMVAASCDTYDPEAFNWTWKVAMGRNVISTQSSSVGAGAICRYIYIYIYFGRIAVVRLIVAAHEIRLIDTMCPA